MSRLSRQRLTQVIDRFEEVEARIAVCSDSDEIIALSKEYTELKPVTERALNLVNVMDAIVEAENESSATDADLAQLAREELVVLNNKLPELEQEMQRLLLPKDADDEADILLEIRAGTGGNEAAIFAGDLYRMYKRFASSNGWSFDVNTESTGEAGGYKEVIAKVSGNGVFALMKWESGVHRVQRVPVTEAQGRVHTSAATVAVLPVPEHIEIEIRESDLRIERMRSSGAGGQHVNKTESAIRMTHIPTGITASSSEKSQHVNREKALEVLKVRLYEKERAERDKARAEARTSQVGSGDRSQKIRTYNFPENRVTDHRIGLTLYSLDRIIEGEKLDEVIEALRTEDETRRLAAIDETGL